MTPEQLRKIAETAPVNLCIQVCMSHFEALIAVAEAAQRAVNMYRSGKAKGVEGPMLAAMRVRDMEKALEKLGAEIED